MLKNYYGLLQVVLHACQRVYSCSCFTLDRDWRRANKNKTKIKQNEPINKQTVCRFEGNHARRFLDGSPGVKRAIPKGQRSRPSSAQLSLAQLELLAQPLPPAPDPWTFGPVAPWNSGPLDPWTPGPLDSWTLDPLAARGAAGQDAEGGCSSGRGCSCRLGAP